MQRHPVVRRAPFIPGPTLLLAALAIGLSGPLAAQSTTRPQLQILQVETDPALETLFIRGRYFVWATDSDADVTLAGYSLAVLNVTEIDGFGLLGDVRVQVNVPLIDAEEEGLKRFGTPALVSFNSGSSQIDVNFGDAIINTIASASSLLANLTFTQMRAEISRIVIESAGSLVELVPPFELQP